MIRTTTSLPIGKAAAVMRLFPETNMGFPDGKPRAKALGAMLLRAFLMLLLFMAGPMVGQALAQDLSITTTHTDERCDGDRTGTITITATNAVGAVEYTIDGGITYGPSNVFTGLASGIHAVVARDSRLIPTAPQNVTIGADFSRPTAHPINSSAATGGGVSIQMTPSDADVSYVLRRDGVIISTPILGTGGAIDFGTQTVLGIYDVVGTSIASGCAQLMTGVVPITIGPQPLNPTISGGEYCAPKPGDLEIGATLTITPVRPGFEYRLFRGTNPPRAGEPIGDWIPSGGTDLSFDNILELPGGADENRYYAESREISTGYVQDVEGAGLVVKNPLPIPYSISLNPIEGHYCEGSTGVNILLENSEIGVTYTLLRNDTPTSISLTGTGNPLTFTDITNTGGPGSREFYRVHAINSTTGCENEMLLSVEIVENALPLDNLIITSPPIQHYCADGNGVDITLSGSEIGVMYRLFLDDVATNIMLPGTGSAITFPSVLAAGRYTIEAMNISTKCSRILLNAGFTRIIIDPLPTKYDLIGGGEFCQGQPGGVDITLTNSETGKTYTLWRNGNVLVATKTGINGTALLFDKITDGGLYSVMAVDNATKCEVAMTNTLEVIENLRPIPFDVAGGGSFCDLSDAEAFVTLSNSELGVLYTLVKDGKTDIASQSGIGNLLRFDNILEAGSYTIKADRIGVNCKFDIKMNGFATVAQDRVPQVYTVTGGGDYCIGASGIAIGLNNSEAGLNYTLLLNGQETGASIVGTGTALQFPEVHAAGVYSVEASFNGKCSAIMAGFAEVKPDAENPVFTTMNALEGFVSGGSTSTLINEGLKAAVGDNCEVTLLTWKITGATVDASPITGINYLDQHEFNLGTSTVTYTAIDAVGNSTAISFEVIVSEAQTDLSVHITSSGAEDLKNRVKEVVYEITARNNGPHKASKVVVSNPLPQDVTFVSLRTTAGEAHYNMNTRMITWTIDVLANGHEEKMILNVKSDKLAAISNTASITSSTQEINPANNQASDKRLLFIMPTLITSNYDDVNDYLAIPGIEEFQSRLQIFNRWGHIIFETENYKNNWRGDNRRQGTYFYILKIKGNNEVDQWDTFKGFFMLQTDK